MKRRKLEDWEWAIIAAWIDTEGCISTHGNRRYAGISITQRDPRPLLWLQERIGGSLTRKRSGVYRLRPSSGSRNIEWILRNCLPYFIGKEEQALAALELCTLPPKERREELHFELRRLKKVRYGPEDF